MPDPEVNFRNAEEYERLREVRKRYGVTWRGMLLQGAKQLESYDLRTALVQLDPTLFDEGNQRDPGPDHDARRGPIDERVDDCGAADRPADDPAADHEEYPADGDPDDRRADGGTTAADESSHVEHAPPSGPRDGATDPGGDPVPNWGRSSPRSEGRR